MHQGMSYILTNTSNYVIRYSDRQWVCVHHCVDFVQILNDVTDNSVHSNMH